MSKVLLFSIFCISQRSTVATYLTCRGTYIKYFAENLLSSPTVKEVWKSDNICHSYTKTTVACFWLTVYTPRDFIAYKRRTRIIFFRRTYTSTSSADGWRHSNHCLWPCSVKSSTAMKTVMQQQPLLTTAITKMIKRFV